MYLISNAKSIIRVCSDCRAPKVYGGSSYVIEDGIIVKKQSVQKSREEKYGKTYEGLSNRLSYFRMVYQRDKDACSETWRKYLENRIKEINDELGDIRAAAEIKTHKQKKYTLNKSKVKKKLLTMAALRPAGKFIGFYSISFPLGMSDDNIFKAFNSWLTNCRKRYGLTSYLWITERQKNGTLHYHMLTLDYMPIKKVNKAMATAISHTLEKDNNNDVKFSEEKYNGVDVDNILQPKRRQGETWKCYQARKNHFARAKFSNSIKWVMAYVTKYVTKCDEEFNHLAWHESRNVSQLLTSEMLTQDSSGYDDVLAAISDKELRIFTNEISTVFYFAGDKCNLQFKRILESNKWLIAEGLIRWQYL